MKRYPLAASILFAVTILGTAHAQIMNADGRNPHGGVAVLETTVFGTTLWGGANDRGTIWSFDTGSSAFANLHDFNRSTDGSSPNEVTLSGKAIFGTTALGGAKRDGTIWSFDISTNSFTNFHDFRGYDGRLPSSSVALSGTTIFGTTALGGANDDGTIWSLDTSSDTFNNHHNLSWLADGEFPFGGVALSGTTLFGTANAGGRSEDGSLWSFETSNNTFTKLHDFSGIGDGGAPRGVTLSGTTLFGTTEIGGADNRGTLWSFDISTNTFANLHDFIRAVDGGAPNEVAALGAMVVGTAGLGGANDQGTLWSFDTSSDTFTKLHDFSGAADGADPRGRVALSGTTVFGTAARGGANGTGTLWSFDTDTNKFTNLHDFSPIPEPSTVTLAAMCALTLLICTRPTADVRSASD